MRRPLLLIDIDGVISLFGFDHAQPPQGNYVAVDGIAHFLSTEAGAQLIALSDDFELVWCSGWEEKADEHLPFALGLPAGLPHVRFEHEGDGDGRHWKLASIDRFAGDAVLSPGWTTIMTPAATCGRQRATPRPCSSRPGDRTDPGTHGDADGVGASGEWRRPVKPRAQTAPRFTPESVACAGAIPQGRAQSLRRSR